MSDTYHVFYEQKYLADGGTLSSSTVEAKCIFFPSIKGLITFLRNSRKRKQVIVTIVKNGKSVNPLDVDEILFQRTS